MQVTLRQARDEDAEEIGVLCVRAYAPSGMAPDAAYWEVLRDTAERMDDSEVMVAYGDHEIVGTVTWCPRGSAYREVATDDEAEFRLLAVDPAAQGRGIGSMLTGWVVERARSEGFSAVALSSARWMTTAHRLYERLGFVHTPERDWTPVPGVDLVTYRLPLAADTSRRSGLTPGR